MNPIKTASTQEEAFNLFTKHNESDGFIQWKGTEICMDFHCECGHSNHYDGFFAYVVKCKNCGKLYALSHNVEMIRVEKADHFLESDL